jgi:hypothetical protein
MNGLSWLEWVRWLDDAPLPRSFINEDVMPEPKPETPRQRAKRLGWKLEEEVVEEQTDE